MWVQQKPPQKSHASCLHVVTPLTGIEWTTVRWCSRKKTIRMAPSTRENESLRTAGRHLISLGKFFITNPPMFFFKDPLGSGPLQKLQRSRAGDFCFFSETSISNRSWCFHGFHIQNRNSDRSCFHNGNHKSSMLVGKDAPELRSNSNYRPQQLWIVNFQAERVQQYWRVWCGFFLREIHSMAYQMP